MVARALRSCAMPSEIIREVLEADDPEIVRRYIELHIEWLEEQLSDRRHTLFCVQRILNQRELCSLAG